MSMIIKRRQLILATLIVALGAAVFVNWYYTGSENLAADETTSADYVQNLGEAKYVNSPNTTNYFTEAKLERDKSNDAAMEKLNDSLEKVSSGTDEAETISQSISLLTARIKAEKDIENIVTGKHSTQCLVIISDDSAQIVVEKGVLNDKTALSILDVATANSKLDPTQISISEIK